MKQIIKEAMGDCSTIGEFRFLLRCQECGRTWHSSPVHFSKAGTKLGTFTGTLSDALDSLYRQMDRRREE